MVFGLVMSLAGGIWLLVELMGGVLLSDLVGGCVTLGCVRVVVVVEFLRILLLFLINFLRVIWDALVFLLHFCGIFLVLSYSGLTCGFSGFDEPCTGGTLMPDFCVLLLVATLKFGSGISEASCDV